jgi:hypothetical protein
MSIIITNGVIMKAIWNNNNMYHGGNILSGIIIMKIMAIIIIMWKMKIIIIME